MHLDHKGWNTDSAVVWLRVCVLSTSLKEGDKLEFFTGRNQESVTNPNLESLSKTPPRESLYFSTSKIVPEQWVIERTVAENFLPAAVQTRRRCSTMTFLLEEKEDFDQC